MARLFTPQLDYLEDRLVPAGGVSSWQDPLNLTFSFAPDGTAVLDAPNQLFNSLQALGPEQWQQEVMRAFQTWAAVTNLNFGLVGDAGLPFGVAGLPQGDPRFGDIRLGAVAQGQDVLAVAGESSLFAGTWGGDLFLNAAQEFSLDGSTAPDLYSVILHEVGHILGLGHSSDTTSVMAPGWNGVCPGLSAADVTAIQALYGVRLPDELEGQLGNETLATATLLSGPTNRAWIAAGDLTTAADVDTYTFHTRGNTESVTVSLQTGGLSLLQPELLVLDEDGQEIATLGIADLRSGRLELQLGGELASRAFYLQVRAAAQDLFGVGSYHLQVEMVDGASASPDGNGGATRPRNTPPGSSQQSPLASAILLLPTRYATEPLHYRVEAQLAAGGSSLYRLHSPNPNELGDARTMLVTLRGLDWQVGDPVLTLFDRKENPIPFEVLLHGDGMVTLQLRDITPSTDYYLRVSGGLQTYFLGIDFTAEPVELTTLSFGLTESDLTNAGTLTLERSALVHLLVSVEGSGSGETVEVFLVDVTGAEMGRLLVPLDDERSTSLLLSQGTYQVLVRSVAGVSYRIQTLELNDPLGPRLEDLLLGPVSPPPPGTDTGTTAPAPNGSGSSSAPSSPDSSTSTGTPTTSPIETSGGQAPSSGNSGSSTSAPGPVTSPAPDSTSSPSAPSSTGNYSPPGTPTTSSGATADSQTPVTGSSSTSTPALGSASAPAGPATHSPDPLSTPGTETSQTIQAPVSGGGLALQPPVPHARWDASAASLTLPALPSTTNPVAETPARIATATLFALGQNWLSPASLLAFASPSSNTDETAASSVAMPSSNESGPLLSSSSFAERLVAQEANPPAASPGVDELPANLASQQSLEPVDAHLQSTSRAEPGNRWVRWRYWMIGMLTILSSLLRLERLQQPRPTRSSAAGNPAIQPRRRSSGERRAMSYP